MKKSKSLMSTAVVMMAITLLGKLMGIVRDNMQVNTLGANTAEGIAFMEASLLPRTFLDIMFASVFSASFIPIFNKYLETKDKKAAFDLASLFITVTLALTLAFTVFCIAFASPVYEIFLHGGAAVGGVRALAVPLLRVMFPLMVLSGLAFSLTGVLQSLGEFKIPAAMSVVSNGVIILYFFFFSGRYGVWGLAAAFLIGWASQVVIQVPFLVRNKFRFRFRFDLKDEGLREIARLALPVTAASWIGPVNMMVGGKALNMFSGGYDYTGFNLANNIYTIASGVFVLTIANVVFPRLSKQAAGADRAAFDETLRATVGTSVFYLLPLSLGLMAVAVPAVRLLYEGELFNAGAVEATSGAVMYFSMGILGYGLQIIASRACYALKDGKSPAYSSVAAIGLNALLCFALARSMGAAGAALASAVSLTFAAGWLVVKLKVTLPVTDLLKMLALALLTFLAARGCLLFLPNEAGLPFATRILCAAVPTLAGGLVYLGGAWILKLRGYMNWKA